MLKKTYPKLIHDFNRWIPKIFDFTEFIVKQGHLPYPRHKEKGIKVFYHYPCHSLNELDIKEEPIQLLKSLGYFPVIEKEPFTCCGFCGVFSFRNPELSHHLWMKKLKKTTESGTSIVVTDCPGCLFQLRSGLKRENEGFKVYHSSELYALEIKLQSHSSKDFHEKRT
jgi:Fe-S oxidoreductase